MKLLIALFVAYSGSVLAAPCKIDKFTDPADVKFAGNQVLIVTHPSTVWDGRLSSKVGMDSAVIYAKKHAIPVVYLVGSDQNQTYFFSDCKPDYWVQSSGGEFSFNVTPNNVLSVGGHWELCQATTQHDLMEKWAAKRGVDLTLTQVLEGLYSYGAYVTERDPYIGDLRRFFEILKYRKPTDDYWTQNKLNMLEMMGVINNEAREIEYIKRNLPPFNKIDASYEVQLSYNGKLIEVLRKGTGTKPPVLKLEYKDSLYEGGYAPSSRKLK